MGLRPLEIFQFFQCVYRLYTSDSDVYGRQSLTYKDGLRAERAGPKYRAFKNCTRLKSAIITYILT